MKYEGGGLGKQAARYSCPVCLVSLELDEWSFSKSVPAFFREEGYLLDQRNLFPHATSLARLVRRSKEEKWPTMRLFFEVMSRAQHFVHFASWGMSHQMIGALKMTSMRVPVFGFVSQVESGARTELTEYPTETPGLKAKVVSGERAAYDAPHQKILIVDGLLAFKGSTNLTNAGMRRADRGLDLSEVVTNFQMWSR